MSFLWAVARLHYASPAARTALRSWQPQPAQLQTHQLVASLWCVPLQHCLTLTLALRSWQPPPAQLQPHQLVASLWCVPLTPNTATRNLEVV